MKKPNKPDNVKLQKLESARSYDENKPLTTNQGVKIADNQNTLKSSERGPSLLEDFIMREKITHFDHERIPERIVHARGEAAHGFFQVYESMARYTKAGFLQDPKKKTPVFVRFSTVAGSRGSADTVRDVRGFAVKFYTDEGNFDLVGNNIPVFFIQDAMKFPDLIHSVKPEPNNEIPQAASAHDTFWDFVSVMPEAMHMIMWAMSDRGIPRSLRMMEGFGIHTFRFVNAKGESHFVKFHWKPLLGVHSVAWDEAQKLAGKDADFHRRDLWDAIEAGQFPEWEFGVQLVKESDEHKFDFDLLDPTKLIPEELVPVKRIGKLTLNRNPDNFFAETEQVAFHPGHVVPGIDFSNDPLLQGRLFSYTDTQISRLGGANFHEIPINKAVCPFHNNQRDGMHRQAINVGQVAYEPNTLANGSPFETPADQGGFESYPERISGHKIRARSESFMDHFSQATLFWQSQAEYEKKHLSDAIGFELSKLTVPEIRTNIVALLSEIDSDLTARVAKILGLTAPATTPKKSKAKLKTSAPLSMANTPKDSIMSRKVATLIANGVDDAAIASIKSALEKGGASMKMLGDTLAAVNGNKNTLKPDSRVLTDPSITFDAIFIPDGVSSLAELPVVIEFVKDAYYHCKPIAATGDGIKVLRAAGVQVDDELGVLYVEKSDGRFAKQFVEAMKQHRFWQRELA